EAGGNSLEHSGARRIELIEAQATDEELQVMAIPARTRAVSGAFRRRQAAAPFDQGSLPIAHGAVERREAVADAGIDRGIRRRLEQFDAARTFHGTDPVA